MQKNMYMHPHVRDQMFVCNVHMLPLQRLITSAHPRYLLIGLYGFIPTTLSQSLPGRSHIPLASARHVPSNFKMFTNSLQTHLQ